MSNQHNYADSIPVKSAHFCNSSAPVLVDNIICRGNENNLLLCTHNGLGIHNCDSTEIAGVICDGNLYLS